MLPANSFLEVSDATATCLYWFRAYFDWLRAASHTNTPSGDYSDPWNYRYGIPDLHPNLVGDSYRRTYEVCFTYADEYPCRTSEYDADEPRYGYAGPGADDNAEFFYPDADWT